MSSLLGLQLLDELGGDAADHGGPGSGQQGIHQRFADLRELSSPDRDDRLSAPRRVSLAPGPRREFLDQ
jgi:hypothetical protein